MSTGSFIGTLIQGAVFIVWLIFLGLIVMSIRGRAVERRAEGDANASTLSEVKAWLTSPEERQTRRTFLFLSFCLAVITLQGAYLGG